MRIQLLSAILAAAIAVSATAQLRPLDPRKLRPQPGPTFRPNATPTPRVPLYTYPLTVTYRNNGTLTYRVYASGAAFNCPEAGARPPVTVTCTAAVGAGTRITLRAEWTSGPSTGGQPVAPRSEPVKAGAWGGDCAAAMSATPTVTMDAAKSCTVG